MENWWEFFRSQRNPVLRSQLITSIMAGVVLEVDRLPKAALADALMLATACREEWDCEIVDNYRALQRRVKEVVEEPDFTHAVMDQLHFRIAYLVACREPRAHIPFPEEHETKYIGPLTQDLLNADVPSYFKKELTYDGGAKNGLPAGAGKARSKGVDTSNHSSKRTGLATAQPKRHSRR